MGKNNRQRMPEEAKMEIARELGIYDRVEKDGDFGNVTSRNCGNIVAKAVERAGKKIK